MATSHYTGWWAFSHRSWAPLALEEVEPQALGNRMPPKMSTTQLSR